MLFFLSEIILILVFVLSNVLCGDSSLFCLKLFVVNIVIFLLFSWLFRFDMLFFYLWKFILI